MKNQTIRKFAIAVVILLLFLLWTTALNFIDVQTVGALGTRVGFASLNKEIHNTLGVNMELYTLTDWLGIVPLVFAMGFALLGLIQLIKRKQIKKVDYDILVLGGFYIVVIAMYLLFESFPVNYRPILIDGRLEASYPSSTTMLVMSIMPTSIMQFNRHIKKTIVKHCISFTMTAFIGFMVIARLLSGVHWFSDIVGGALLSAGLVMFYSAVISLKSKRAK